MGMADVVPGFSGGTVALITGIYRRLVTAISHFDREFLNKLRERQFRVAADHIDFRFLAVLGVGVGCGFVMALLTIHKLLDEPSTRPFVLAAFLGMVVGSAWFVWQMIAAVDERIHWGHWLLMSLGIAVAVATCLLPPSLWMNPPLWYVFVCGAIGICAMILPGISGALILMLLGTYKYFTGIAHELVHRENLVHGVTVSAVFGIGCLTGLLTFSKLLKNLFQTYPGLTLSVLFGLMLGSLAKLWPFRTVETRIVDGVELELERMMWPSLGMTEIGVFTVAVVFALAIFAIGSMANRPEVRGAQFVASTGSDGVPRN